MNNNITTTIKYDKKGQVYMDYDTSHSFFPHFQNCLFALQHKILTHDSPIEQYNNIITLLTKQLKKQDICKEPEEIIVEIKIKRKIINDNQIQITINSRDLDDTNYVTELATGAIARIINDTSKTKNRQQTIAQINKVLKKGLIIK